MFCITLTCPLRIRNCRSLKIIPALKEFLTQKGITIASVDTRADKRMLARAGIEIPDEYHVDLQDLFQL